VIGVDLRVDLLFPLQPGVQDFPLLSLGEDQITLSMGHLEFNDPGFTPLTGHCRFALRVGDELMEFTNLTVFHQQTTRFHARWHTHGQAQLSHDGVLRAHQPGVAAGKSFTVDRVTIGGPLNAPVALAPRFLARRVYVKVLRRHDAIDDIDRQLPIDTYPLPRSECSETIRDLHDALMVPMRAFMADTVAELTRPWREGDAGAPFTPEATRAHAAAVAAGRAFYTFLSTRDAAAFDAVLEHIGDFFDVLAAANPARFADVLSELTARAATLDPYCRETFKPLVATNAATLQPLRTLLAAVHDRARAAASRPGEPHA
jgi:hypothetical protein